MTIKMRVRKCPTDDLALTNCAILNANALNGLEIKHLLVKTGPAHHFVFSVRNHPSLKADEIAFALSQRKWANLSLDQEVEVQQFNFKNNQFIGSITFAADFQSKKNQTSEPLNTDHMAREFSIQFSGHAFTRGELLVFKFDDDKGKTYTLALKVTSILGIDLSLATNPQALSNLKPIEIDAGQLLPNSVIIFDKAEDSEVSTSFHHQSRLGFSKMGIGGLDKEFSGIFRRAFASRVFPPEFIEQLGMKHVRGILLYGPPGTGKTLMARQIGKMLNAREPKIINGPQILDKYVGESESNIRKLFADAEEEWKRCGANSGLHIIIFDEIDAICKQRGSVAGSTAVHDTVVNQLLAKMDGVDQLNNILVIGMTNRKDMIDEALLRPGRMEVQMEISLPDEAGRLQILKIHTARMRYGAFILKIMRDTFEGSAGAELEGLIRAAQSSAMNRLVKAGGKVQLDADAVEKLMINVDDFNYALENDVKPAFGHSNEELEKYLVGGFISWSAQVTQILEQGALLVKQVRSPDTKGFASVLLAGSPNSGKTCFAAMIAKASDYPFIKVISAEDMVGYTETAKCATLRKVFDDAYRSPLSCVIVDGVERLLDFSPIGPRYSNLVLQALFLLVKKLPPQNRRLLVIATSSNRSFLRELGLLSAFCTIIDVPALTTVEHIMAVIEDTNALSRQECEEIRSELSHSTKDYFIGIKKLLNVVDMARECEPVDRVSVIVQSLMSETFSNS
ncbi:Vesicle-fusing ATPase [Dirofilaria immitis]|nr:Vesicle-fusing ATPase [Dirofilaria immitis]